MSRLLQQVKASPLFAQIEEFNMMTIKAADGDESFCAPLVQRLSLCTKMTGFVEKRLEDEKRKERSGGMCGSEVNTPHRADIKLPRRLPAHPTAPPALHVKTEQLHISIWKHSCTQQLLGEELDEEAPGGQPAGVPESQQGSPPLLPLSGLLANASAFTPET